MDRFILDAKEMTSVEMAHKYIAQMMSFPDYYGENLDALWDMLSEICEPTEIVLQGYELLKKQLGKDAEELVQVFVNAQGENEEVTFILE